MIEVHYFAAARQAAGCAMETVPPQDTLGQLLDSLVAAGNHATTAAGMPFAEVLQRCTFLADGTAATPAQSLAGVQRVDILPPFAGG